MINYEHDYRAARAALTYLAEPAEPLIGELIQTVGPCGAVAAIRTGALPATALEDLDEVQEARAWRALSRWQARLNALPPGIGPDTHEEHGIRLVCPGDPGWPGQFEDLGTRAPYALWVRGCTDLRTLCRRSVAVVGSRAATAYGRTVCAGITSELCADGWTIISGGAYGIDARTHTAALAGGGRTIAILACGPDQPYPREHAGLFERIAEGGAVISEHPPGTSPSRQRFLLRNRLITALASGTLVVEAAPRSGSLVTARQASALGRRLMAVPGPVTSAMSAGCHHLIREQGATLVTSAADVIECL